MKLTSAKINNIPELVLLALSELGYDDAAIEEMTPEQMFAAYCEWEGLIGYGPELWNIVVQLNKKFDRNGKFRV